MENIENLIVACSDTIFLDTCEKNKLVDILTKKLGFIKIYNQYTGSFEKLELRFKNSKIMQIKFRKK